jgi:hypothetical protein
MRPIFHNIFNGTFLLAVAFVCGFLLCHSTLNSPSGAGDGLPAPSQGYEAVLSYDNGLQVYFQGEEMTVKEWQRSMGFIGTKVDGAAGATMNKALELNRLQKVSE